MQNKKKMGIIVAIEISAIFKIYNDIKELSAPCGYKLFKVEKQDFTLFILQAGMGEVASSAGVQYLISKCKVQMIVNFGVVGGLTPSMKKQKICLVNRVVHYRYDISELSHINVGQVDGHDSLFLKPDENLIKSALNIMPELPLVTCCSGDKFISTEQEKKYIHDTFSGDICDMEASGIVLTCEANNIPCIMFKAVSDGLSDGTAGFLVELESASIRCLQVADKIMEKIALE